MVPDDAEAASGGDGEVDSSSSSRAYDSLHSLLMARSALYGEWYLQSVSEKLRRRDERDEADDGGGGTTEAEGKASASASAAAAAEWDRYISALAAGHVDNEDDGDMEFDERLMFGVASMAKAAREAAAGVGVGGGGGAAEAGAGADASSAGRG